MNKSPLVPIVTLALMVKAMIVDVIIDETSLFRYTLLMKQ